MAIMEGTRAVKTWHGSYDFAVDGGATGDITLRSEEGPIPAGAIVTGGYIDITTACASGSGTMAIAVEGSGDTLGATGEGSLGTGRIDIIPDATGSTALKTTQARSPELTIATAAFTAGVFELVLFYR